MSKRMRRTFRPLGLALLLTGVVALPQLPAQAQNVVWVRQFGSPDHDAATSVAVDPGGNVYVAGWTDGALPGQTFAGGPRDAFVRKYDAGGNELWTRQFGTSQTDVVMDAGVGPGGDVHVVGQTGGGLAGQTAAGGFDAFVRKYDRNGTELWTQEVATSDTDIASRLFVDPAGNVYLAGWTAGTFSGQRSAGLSDAFVAKLK